MSMDEFYSPWEKKEYSELPDSLKQRIYDKYLVKCEVFTRDNFECQNLNCETKGSPLTMHHVRFQKNGGEDKSRNCITICNSCHKRYHKGNFVLMFIDKEELPSHIRGHSFRIDYDIEINWKEERAKSKAMRKEVKHLHGIRISFEWIRILFNWLTVPYNEMRP